MYFRFAWRYFKAKKSTNAINIIAWVTTGVIAFATCCQILVLSVFNGFEDLVKSLYASFYTDIKITPATGKTFHLDPQKITSIQHLSNVKAYSLVAEEKALLKHDEYQSIVQLKGVDKYYQNVCDISSKIIMGDYSVGDSNHPSIVMGSGIQNATAISVNEAAGPELVTVILPKSKSSSNDPMESLSEGNAFTAGVFSIQQDFDNSYALTNIDFVKQQMGLDKDEYSGMEIKLYDEQKNDLTKKKIEAILGKKILVKNRYQQNANLYSTMKTEKWAIYALLCLILIIAAFNIISALTMLVLEKKQDIAILNSLGAKRKSIKNIFLTEGLLIGVVGCAIGISMASLICFFQLKYKWIHLEGGTFLIDYFPVKLSVADYIIVSGTALVITFIASWIPANKASKQTIELK